MAESKWQARLQSSQIGQHQDSVLRAGSSRLPKAENTIRSVLTGVTDQQFCPLQLVQLRCSLSSE
jgi:hypothetical protein